MQMVVFFVKQPELMHVHVGKSRLFPCHTDVTQLP
ncbi:hypothetical protein DET54_107143 [Paenibacillus pabuli]|uniref:Uncharacterized protein n=1 Tax=Paenibacillus pabuli TaxID=1472 RepID=A0A855YC25_9BACL|nr:hypothetical protein DET56_104299 [Paenibacillus pabuli]PXW07629.1 hypothetical protein DEU73_105298 [Paenibacillus taichungensis]RAI94607.1 hypothetical protein DET54_107143 [Paenibacillus pabuli]